MKETRYDHKARTGRTGRYIPESFEIYFEQDGKEIAWYNSRENTLFLKTDYIAHKSKADFAKPYEVRIVGSKYENQFKELIEKYGKFAVSEYR